MHVHVFTCCSICIHHDHVQDGATALIVAAHKGYCGVVRILLEAKADVHIKTNVSHIYIGIII